MKTKELKNLAKKIAVQEQIVQTTDDMSKRARAEAEIISLTSRVESWEDLSALDELVQDFLEKT